uniref:Uncharacterized protein n=1 Tax=Anguilla anguilla TaxID=7936 RepID=A0A0E9R5D8_ANGAN
MIKKSILQTQLPVCTVCTSIVHRCSMVTLCYSEDFYFI